MLIVARHRRDIASRPNRWAAGALLAGLLLAGLACADDPALPEAPVTLAVLLSEMTDPLHLARFPVPFYRGLLASSTDRSASTPAEKDAWFKNEDLDNYVREEPREGRIEYVMLDAEGPGAVTRIWSANPQGTLRIYIDGAQTPVLEADMEALLSGQVEPFQSPFAYTAARGKNLYFPFPYAKSCKITMDERGAFYQVNHRSYAPGVSVNSYTPIDLERNSETIADTAAALQRPPQPASATPGAETAAFVGETELRGSRVVRSLVLKPSSTRPADLRRITLVIEADGIETVRVPLGDFFGAGPGLHPYASFMTSVSPGGTLTARWPMPFRESLSIRLLGKGDVQVHGEVVHTPWNWDSQSLYFFAAWRHEHELPSWPPRDWTLIAIQGRGVYVGTLFEIANASKGWWGEGDEKIWVDDDTFPSQFGTGTEDYFGYAWSTPNRFARPYHGQTRADGPGGYGHFAMYRWHILDPLPFRTSLRFDQELWHWMRKTEVSLSGIAFFYGAPGLQHSGLRIQPGNATIPVLPPLPQKTLQHAIEAERMAASASGGRAEPEGMIRYLVSLWSGDEQLRWRGPKLGDRLTLRFDAPRAGRYRVLAHFTRAPEYGIHQVSLNGKPLGEPRDLWSHVVSAQEDIDLGIHRLRGEGNQLTVVVTGSNPRGPSPGYDFGLDALQLVPVDAPSP